MVLQEKIKKLATDFFPEIVAVRRHLHQNPELSFQEFNTSKYIQEQLTKHNITFTSGYVTTGIIATIKGNNAEKQCTLIRADMDALPIQEENNVAYCSINKNVMHACGHDAHTACALGAAFILNQIKSEIEGTVKIMFQPGEEVLPGGAKLMIEAGVLQNPKVDKAIALHVFPSIESGNVGFKPGMYMASTDELHLTINGKGGHAAMPAEYINPLVVASEIILEVNKKYMLASNTTVPTVVAFGKIEGLGATNVIPPQVRLQGTFRTMDEIWRKQVHKELHELINEICSKYNASADFKIEHGYPFLVNNEQLTSSCENKAKNYLGENYVHELPLRMTAEDFAFITQQVPSCFFRLGTANKAAGITSGVHTPTFDIDEKSLEIGMGLLAYFSIN